MTKYLFSLVFALLMVLLPASKAQAASKAKHVYLFGVATSFNDSTVYFTDIQELDSAYISAKTGFLQGRDAYAYQLRNHLSEAGAPQRTVSVYFNTELKKIKRLHEALFNRYYDANKRKRKLADRAAYIVKQVATSDFQFTAVAPNEQQETVVEPQPKAKKQKPKGKPRKGKGGPAQGGDAPR